VVGAAVGLALLGTTEWFLVGDGCVVDGEVPFPGVGVGVGVAVGVTDGAGVHSGGWLRFWGLDGPATATSPASAEGPVG
jgi:hypothetical protein